MSRFSSKWLSLGGITAAIIAFGLLVTYTHLPLQAVSDSFMPHGYCLAWDPDLLCLFVVGNGLVALAYYSIPAALWIFIRRRRDLAFNWMFRLFAAFIFLCGTTHLMKLWTIWNPAYWAEGIIDLLTGIFSGFTAIVLWPLIPKALALPGPAQWEATNRQLTELLEQRRQAENLLRESYERHRSILEKTSEAFIAIDGDGRITDWNTKAEETFGWTRSEAMGRTLVETIIPERYRQRHIEGIDHYRKTGEAQVFNRLMEMEALHKDGYELPIELSITPLKTGDETSFFAFLRDITQRRRSQRELAQARDQALEASRFKSEFLANMSHEIRTPMNAVIGMSDLLSRTPLIDEQREYATIIHTSADTLLDLINDILDYSKIEAGKIDLEIIDFEVLSVVEGSAELMAARAREKNLSLMTYVAPDVPPVMRGDPARIRQVLLNLTSNAVKFTSQGEVVIRATLESDSDSDEVTIRFSVSDTGIGIGLSSPSGEALFMPFTQASQAITRNYGGTGLGLSISKSLVDLMGGHLDLKSEVGTGSQFWFTLPLKRSPGTGRTRSERTDLRDVRILVVDGPPGVTEIIQAYSASWGIRCSSSSSLEAAISLMRCEASANDAYDIVFIDLSIGKDQALALPRMIEKHASLKETKLVLLSAAANLNVGREFVEHGYSAFLPKPIKQSRLFDCLIGVLRPGGTPIVPATRRDASGTLETQQQSRSSSNGRLILVVEDNTVNQKVALLLLRELGYAGHAVANGLEAVEALRRSSYALVLMDCQMPDVDGFEATKQIREIEALSGRHTPIIALTAHAMSSDRDKCLSAGMDDYLSKPVTAKKLQSILHRYVTAKESADLAPGATTDFALPVDERRTADQCEPIDIQILYQTYGKKAGAELVREFVNEAAKLMKLSQQALEGHDLMVLRTTVHSLKGACAATYATELTSICRELEEALDSEEKDKIAPCHMALSQAWQKTADFLEQQGYVREAQE